MQSAYGPDGIYRQIYQNIPVAIVVTDAENRIVQANPEFCHLLGYTAEELLGVDLNTLADTDPKFRNIKLKSSPLRDHSGNTTGTLTLAEKTSGSDETQAASEVLFRMTADMAPVFIWVAGPDKRRTWFNKRWLDFTGRTIEQEDGHEWAGIAHPEDAERCTSVYESHFDEQLPFSMEYRLRRNDGEYRWVLENGVPRTSASGQFLGYICSGIDIHDRMESEQSLHRTNEELRQANEDLKQFAYSASHDLREPLRMISVYTQLLHRRYREKLDSEAERYIYNAVLGAQRMEMLVRDLLAYTQVASISDDGPVLSDADAAFREAIDVLGGAIRETGATVRTEFLPRLAIRRTHLVLLFQNLLGNALKYRRDDLAPSVMVTAQRQGGFWQIRVADNGIGIDPRYGDQVFGLFRRLHGRDKYTGTGLGLAICRKITERCGGRIWVESEGDGAGSAFCFTLPGAD